MAAIGSVRTSAYLLALLAGSALLAAYFYVGPFGSDDLQYVQLAVGGQPSLGTARYAVSGYYLFWARWVDVWLAAYAFFLYAFALGAAAYVFARKFVAVPAAMLAGMLTAFHPLAFYYAAAILPDNPLGLFFLIHVGAFATFAWRRGGPWMAMLSGAALGACFVTKEASVMFAAPTAFAGAWLLVSRRHDAWAGALAFVSALALVVLVDMGVSRILFGDPIYRLTYSAEHDVVAKAKVYMETQGIQPADRFEHIMNRLVGFVPRSVLLLNGIAVVSLPLLAWNWKRELFAAAIYVSASAMAVFAYLTWGSISLKEYVGVPLQPRYYLPAMPLAAICTAAILWAACNGSGRRPRVGMATFVMLGVVLVAIQAAKPIPSAGRAYRAQEMAAISRAVSQIRKKSWGIPIVGDSYVSQRYVPYGASMDVLAQDEIQRQTLSHFVLIVADSNTHKKEDVDRVRRCAGAVRNLGDTAQFLVPANRKGDIALMFGDVANVEFESKPRVAIYEVRAFRAGCQHG